MISNLSDKITDKLISKKIVDVDERDLYSYALYMIISYLAFFNISLIFGVMFRSIIESIVFYFSFSVIRNLAGGIHADSEKKCFVFTTISLMLCIAIIFILKYYELTIVSIVISVCSAFVLILLRPIDTENKRLSKSEKIKLHKKVIVVTIITFSVSTILLLLNITNISYSLSVGLMLASILLLLGQFNYH